MEERKERKRKKDFPQVMRKTVRRSHSDLQTRPAAYGGLFTAPDTPPSGERKIRRSSSLEDGLERFEKIQKFGKF